MEDNCASSPSIEQATLRRRTKEIRHEKCEQFTLAGTRPFGGRTTAGRSELKGSKAAGCEDRLSTNHTNLQQNSTEAINNTRVKR